MRHVSRRTMLVGAGVGLGALADGARRPLLAQAARASAGPMWSAEYTAKKGDVSLALYRKRIGVPKAGERRVLADECVRWVRIRRVDDGPRGLREVHPDRRQL